MAEASKAEIKRTNDSLATGVPTLHKGLSLISMVPKWSVSEAEFQLEELFSCVEGTASIGRWGTGRTRVPFRCDLHGFDGSLPPHSA